MGSDCCANMEADPDIFRATADEPKMLARQIAENNDAIED